MASDGGTADDPKAVNWTDRPTKSNTKKKDEGKKKKKKRRKMMYLKLEDGVFVISKEYIAESDIFNSLYHCGYYGMIHLSIKGKSSAIIKRALQFCKERGEIRKKHQDDENQLLQDKLKDFDTNFLQHNQADAFDLADAACRLQIKSLFYLMTSVLADAMAQKNPDDIRKIFDIYYHQDSVVNFGKLKRVLVGNVQWAFK